MYTLSSCCLAKTMSDSLTLTLDASSKSDSQVKYAALTYESKDAAAGLLTFQYGSLALSVYSPLTLFLS
jgi:hypothetical protein